ncbi:adenosylcobyric acid synthase [Desulfohalotomaculum tongense]|uniref:cobyric acid synthase n=1 Tax=Desulforadius tongensis TaxID=1216062 RepID=UPI001EE52F15|nr:cobyric acid synthase [Desulforadius tongensis]MBM7854336.1 adenosylcobyric acid synthase [Desulforadius tongensis]
MDSKAKTIMLQGTSSHVGKSLLCTALCRIFKQDGYRVAPFKAQNMALNSFVTAEGDEIGRAQGVQAEAAGVPAEARMNPVLLKPKADMDAQVIVMGKPLADMSARDYRARFLPRAVALVQNCIDELRRDFHILVIEGAGSPAEVNLKDKDIVNMKTAELADAPVLLVADIDRGGVFASLVGTLELLAPHERERVAGFIINKFRGDISLLRPGLDFLEQRTGKPVLGVIPYLHRHGVDQEDSVVLSENPVYRNRQGDIDIAVIKLPRISNFTDLDPLFKVPGNGVRFVEPGEELGRPDVIILPGTKNSVLDMQRLWQTNTARDIISAYHNRVSVVGICGGYQMLGQVLLDPEGLEGTGEEKVPGLGLLDMETIFKPGKITRQVQCVVKGSDDFWHQLQQQRVKGYEIHSGHSRYGASCQPVLVSGSDIIGVTAPGGRVWGTYLHGIFDNKNFTLAWINNLRRSRGLPEINSRQVGTMDREAAYDKLADQVREHLDMKKLYQIMGVNRHD